MTDPKPIDGGPAYPRSESGRDQAQVGMSLRDHFAGMGAHGLPALADDELWAFFRANTDGVLEAIREYDAYIAKRDWRYADALLAARQEPQQDPVPVAE